ncbi:unnamed protein product [Anisakis simplex]|uniref:CC domain-containing protein n=1 Tax=Anisakis simplex TaxID=6269 RepID=A0A0M3JX36_ANISI|nr:unnamed protein product [Anisakis simplex]
MIQTIIFVAVTVFIKAAAEVRQGCPAGQTWLATGCRDHSQCSTYATKPYYCYKAPSNSGECCQITSPVCGNGGTVVKAPWGCSFSLDCTAYTDQPVTCDNGLCCTVSPPADCDYGGTFTGHFCNSPYDCRRDETKFITCLSGRCCTIPPNCPYNRAPIAVGCANTGACLGLAHGIPQQCPNGSDSIAMECQNVFQCLQFSMAVMWLVPVRCAALCDEILIVFICNAEIAYAN